MFHWFRRRYLHWDWGFQIMNLWIAIPVFNEEKVITGLLEKMKTLSNKDAFNVVFCDNQSTDGTRRILHQFILDHKLSWRVIEEQQKGTGAAADTAIRYAITQGATHVARTDADCLPADNWVERLQEIFATTSMKMVAGKITARLDDVKISSHQAKIFNAVVPLAAWFGKHRPLNKGAEYQGPYVMTAGCNMAITAELYIQVGGFPRTKIEDVHEDHMLVNAVRKVTSSYCYDKSVHVQVSARRIAEWGIIRTLKWYANHSYKPEIVDIR